MTEKEPNSDISTTAECVDDADADARPEAAKATSGDDVPRVSALFEFFKDLEKSEGASDAQALRYWIPMTITQDISAGLDIQLHGGRTLLHFAALEGLKAAAKRLVNVKAILNARNDSGRTPLYDACWGEHIDIVRILLEAGADSKIFDNDGWSPLYIAARYRCSDITQLLLEKRNWDLDFKEKLDGRTPLHAAARGGGGETVRHLRAKGAKLDLRDDAGWTPLMTAVMGGEQEEDALRELLEPRNDEDLQLETKDEEGRSPLFRAAEDNYWDGVRILVESHAKYNTSKIPKAAIDTYSTPGMASDKNIALHFAVRENNIEIVGFLLEREANVNARNREWHQPLHLASVASDHDSREHSISDSEANIQIDGAREVDIDNNSLGHIDMVRLLLDNGADTHAETKNGKTAMELAYDYGHHNRVKTIFDVFAKADDGSDDLLTWAAERTERHWIAISLFERRFQTPSEGPTVKMSERWTAIEWAAHAKVAKVLWLLIASSPRNNETKKALESAKSIVEHSTDQAAKPSASPGDKKREQRVETRKSGKSENMQTDLEIQDVINNPPTGLICTDSPTYDLPTYDSRFSNSLRTHQAGIVRCYKKKGQFETVIQFRTVEDTVYRQGPEKIIHEVIEKFKEHSVGLSERIAKPPIFMDSPPRFTWVHLPATNMVWMDNLVQRIMKDEDEDAGLFNQAKSFFKDSWIEIPDKSSASRMMRPRFVSRDAVSRDTKDDDAQKQDAEEMSMKNANDEKESGMEEGGSIDLKVDDVADGTKSADQEQKELLYEEAPTPAVAATAIYIPYLSYSFQCSEGVAKSAQVQRPPGKGPAGAENVTTHTHTPADPESQGLEHKQEAEHGSKSKHENEVEFARNLADSRRKYEALLGKYSKSIIHGSSTLDESYYHFGEDSESTKDRDRRNKTQVATGRWVIERERKRQEQKEQQQKEQQQKEQQQKEQQQKEQQQKEQQQKEQQQKEPEQPEEEQPEPEQPEPEQPEPEQQGPEQKEPEQPEPEQPGPEQPEPEQPGPEQKEPEQKEPEQPEQEQKEQVHPQTKQDLGPYWLLIRVNQLWIWTINNKWLISSSSHPIDNSENELFNGILDRLEKQGEVGGSNLQPGSAAEMSQMIVDYCVDSYERKPKAQKDDRLQFFKSQDFTSIRQAFSKSINSIARDETILFDKFSNLTKELRKQSKDKTRDHSKAIELMDHQLAEAIIEAEGLSSRVKDILDELSILEATVQYQQDVQRAMKKQNAQKAMKKESFLETELTATYIINDIKGLGSVAERVHAAVNTTLSLQQSEIANLQAKLSIEHAKLSIEHAELATRQGRVFMVFTVVTILFLPMSFLTSLFALDVASFQQAPAWALVVIFLVSLALFIPAVCFAFAWEGSKRFVLGPMRKLIHHAMLKPLGLDAKDISEQSIGSMWKLAWSSNRPRAVKSNSNPAVGSSGAPVQVAPQRRTGLSDLLRFRSRRHKDVEEGGHKQ